MNHKNLKTRTAALLALGVLGVGALLQPAPAQASSKEKLYKGGAVALGVLGAYFILKGKTVPGAIAGAGAYYAYKKSKDAARDNRYPNYDVYSQYPGNNSYPSQNYPNQNYPGNNSYPDYNRSGDVYANNPGSYGAPAYLAPRQNPQSKPHYRLK